MNLSAFSVKQPIATLMLFLAFTLLGTFALLQLNVDMMPDIEPPVVSIITAWPGASASDVQTEVTEAIEDYVNGVSNLDKLTSKSLDNMSIVSCRFDWGTDLDVASNDLRSAIGLVKRELPDDAEEPVLFKFSSSVAPILFMTVTAETSWPRLYHIADKQIADDLKRVPGVGAILIQGGARRRFNVYFDRERIEGYHLSLARINAVLAAENRNIPGGRIKSGAMDYFVRIPARYRTAEEMGQTVVGMQAGRPVYLKDVARVADDFKPQDHNGWGDGKPAVVLILQKQSDKNTVEVARAVQAHLERLQTELPADVEIQTVMDTSQDILSSLANLRGTLFWGIVLVSLVALVFLRRLRTAIIVVLTIPASLIIAFILIYLAGYTINLVSLMALAIATGMVVDNGIVVLENITRHVENGRRIDSAAVFGAREMGLAITASTLTTVVIFVPLMFLTGLAGIIFKQLGFVLVVTLMASLLTALMLTPMLCSRWMTTSPTQLRLRQSAIGRLYAVSEKGFEALEQIYRRLLVWALGHPYLVVLLAGVVFVSSLSLIPRLSTSFFPEMDSGAVELKFRLTEGLRIEETNKVIRTILNDIDEVVRPEEMRHSYAIDGESEEGLTVALGFEEGPNVGTIGFKLVDRDQRERSAKEIAAALRERVSRVAGIDKIKVTAQNLVMAALSGATGKPVSVEIQGTDLDAILAYAERLHEAMAAIPGLVDLEVSQKAPRPEIWVDVDRDRASALGLNAAMIGGTLRNYYYGFEASRFREEGYHFDIFTRLKTADKDDLDGLADMPLFTPDGRMVRLKSVADIVRGSGPIEIERKNRQTIVRVEGDLYRRSLGEITADVRGILATLDHPPGVSVVLGGDVEEQRKAFHDMTLLLVLGVCLVYMLMAALFGNLRDPLIIMFAVPFAFTGVIYAFYFTGTTLGIMSFMGIIMLMGIVVNNAIVLLDYMLLMQKRGLALREAITQAGAHRLRPVLMTTLTTFFGMLPMAISDRVGAEAWNPLGITLLGGLSVSTLVTLLLIPTLYYLLERRKMGRKGGAS